MSRTTRTVSEHLHQLLDEQAALQQISDALACIRSIPPSRLSSSPRIANKIAAKWSSIAQLADTIDSTIGYLKADLRRDAESLRF
jgi:hypothetical protein